MCESTAFVKKGDEEILLLKDVARIAPAGNGVLLVESILGEQKEFKGVISEIDFMAHKITLAEK